VPEFSLSGDGLATELVNLAQAMKDVDPDMATIFEAHVELLTGAMNDEQRKAARIAFNSAVRADLISLSDLDA